MNIVHDGTLSLIIDLLFNQWLLDNEMAPLAELIIHFYIAVIIFPLSESWLTRDSIVYSSYVYIYIDITLNGLLRSSAYSLIHKICTCVFVKALFCCIGIMNSELIHERVYLHISYMTGWLTIGEA